MISFILAFLGLSLIIGVLGWLSLHNITPWKRVAFISVFSVFLVILFFGASDMLGRPKSTRLELLRSQMPHAVVIASQIMDGAGIYLWLKIQNVSEPRYYVLPWSKKLAKQLEDAIERNAQNHGGGIGLNLPFEHSWDRETPLFYPLPQPKMPDKPGEPTPKIYTAPSNDT